MNKPFPANFWFLPECYLGNLHLMWYYRSWHFGDICLCTTWVFVCLGFETGSHLITPVGLELTIYQSRLASNLFNSAVLMPQVLGLHEVPYSSHCPITAPFFSYFSLCYKVVNLISCVERNAQEMGMPSPYVRH